MMLRWPWLKVDEGSLITTIRKKSGRRPRSTWSRPRCSCSLAMRGQRRRRLPSLPRWRKKPVDGPAGQARIGLFKRQVITTGWKHLGLMAGVFIQTNPAIQQLSGLPPLAAAGFGLPIFLDEDLSSDVCEFRNKDGKVLKTLRLVR
jgi:hypothetical protein